MQAVFVSAANTSSGQDSTGVAELLKSAPHDRARVLQRRLRKEMPALRETLERLYGESENFESLVDRLVLSALKSAVEREDELWSLDLQREEHPGWHQQGMTGYCAYVDKFAGTLDGVKSRIDYLREVGVTYLHLLPFLKAGQAPNDGGFAVASFSEIEPSLGTWDSLTSLCSALRTAEISLCSDFVLNHVSNEHPWAMAARAGDAHYQKYFHWFKSQAEVAAQEEKLNQVFPSTAPGNFSYVEEVKAWTWTTFYPYQWDLNYANPEVFLEMAKALLHLANAGVESFRLDSTGYLWKRLGTPCTNQPEVHWILQALRSITNIAAPCTLLKAEAIMPTKELPPYFGMGLNKNEECHLAYHSSLMAAGWASLAEENPSIVREVLRNTPDLPPGCAWLTYVRCHDDIGWNVLRPELVSLGSDPLKRLNAVSNHFSGEVANSYSNGALFQSNGDSVHGTNGMTASLCGLPAASGMEEFMALARIELLYSLSFFTGGIPLIYMGDELGMTNVSSDELAARSGTDGRELHRPTFDMHLQARRNNAMDNTDRIFHEFKKLNDARLRYLDQGQPVSVRLLENLPEEVLGLRRNRVVGLFNFSNRPTTINLHHVSEKPLRNVFDSAQNTLHRIRLPAYGTAWLTAIEATFQ